MAANDNGPKIAGVTGFFLGLSWIFFPLRIYVRAYITGNWGLDDLFLIISIVLFTIFCIFGFLSVKYGAGRHVLNILPEDLSRALRFWFIAELFYVLTTVFIRLSISVFLIRICVTRIHRIIVYTTMTMVVVCSSFYFFLCIFQCSPVDYFWGRYKDNQGNCTNVQPEASIAYSVVSCMADWVLGLFPIALIWNLQMDQRTKMSIAAILSLGILAGVSTIIRIPYIHKAKITNDFPYIAADVHVWATIEAGLLFIAACAYTFRPLFRSFFTSYSHSSGGRNMYVTANQTSCTAYSREARERNLGTQLRPVH